MTAEIRVPAPVTEIQFMLWRWHQIRERVRRKTAPFRPAWGRLHPASRPTSGNRIGAAA